MCRGHPDSVMLQSDQLQQLEQQLPLVASVAAPAGLASAARLHQELCAVLEVSLCLLNAIRAFVLSFHRNWMCKNLYVSSGANLILAVKKGRTAACAGRAAAHKKSSVTWQQTPSTPYTVVKLCPCQLDVLVLRSVQAYIQVPYVLVMCLCCKQLFRGNCAAAFSNSCTKLAVCVAGVACG